MRLINALALLSGNIGRSGGGAYFHLHSYRNLDLGWIKGPGHKGRRALHIALSTVHRHQRHTYLNERLRALLPELLGPDVPQ